MVASPIQDVFDVFSDISYDVPFQLALPCVPVFYHAIVIAGLATVSPEEDMKLSVRRNVMLGGLAKNINWPRDEIQQQTHRDCPVAVPNLNQEQHFCQCYAGKVIHVRRIPQQC